MASTESINVEMNIGGGSKAAGGSYDTSILGRIRKLLNPGQHTILENALAAVVLLLFIIVIALAATHGAGGGTVAPSEQTCQLQSCLYRSGYVASLTNLSANPCDDFYKYACGGADLVYPINPSLQERGVLSDVSRRNADKLETILLSPVTRDTPNSYERKLKLLFSKCVDDFAIERIRGSDLVKSLSPNFYVVNDSMVDKFDLDRMLLSAVKTYGVSAFFQYYVEPNQLDANRYTILIDMGGIAMESHIYLYRFFRRQQEAYRAYIRSVAQLLVDDAPPGTVQANPEARIENFVEDVMQIETALANITYFSDLPDEQPLKPENQVSLSDMNRLYNGISWTSLFIQLFESSAQESTKVAILEPDYLNQVTTYIRETLAILYPVDYKRKLSNYLNWQIIRSFTGELSSSYVHAMREFEYILSTRSYVVQSRFDYCFDRIRMFMPKGLNSLFVADHVVDQTKNAVDDMYKVLQTQLISGIDRLDWIEAAVREKAKRKVRAIVDKIGYSVREVEDSYLDDFYGTFRVDPRDKLMDMSMNWQIHNRAYLGSLLGTQLSNLDWTGETFDTRVSMSLAAELTIPAGILQWPIFTKQLPAYINYASIGQRIATELVKSIDATGQRTDEKGNRNPMWTNQTMIKYAEKTKCVNSTFSKLRAGPYLVSNRTLYVDVGPIIQRTLRQAVAELDALRMAVSAYQGSAAAKTERPLPLVHLNNRQTFFVSWAQSFCYTREPRYAYFRALWSRTMPEEIHVNGILSMLPEFGQAFQCPAGSNMVRAEGGCDPIFYK